MGPCGNAMQAKVCPRSKRGSTLASKSSSLKGGSAMGRKKRPEPDNKEQSARFIETVERIGLVDDPEKKFKEAFNKIAKSPKRPTPETT